MRSPVSIIPDFCQATLQGTHTDETNAAQGDFKATHLAALNLCMIGFLPAHKRLKHSARCEDIHTKAAQHHTKASSASCPDSGPPQKMEPTSLSHQDGPLHIVWPHR
ncbi:hypothetical protein DNTS_018420 [Danionella cerebrum]|uniref:Uncharacterized protein n=1 Tax=Danionella cerebrum TaxID=2873325 RepID=A0A553RGR0_9TELE|nr:hypothetical protein DNTS_018420 [Danionella translucida]